MMVIACFGYSLKLNTKSIYARHLLSFRHLVISIEVYLKLYFEQFLGKHMNTIDTILTIITYLADNKYSLKTMTIRFIVIYHCTDYYIIADIFAYLSSIACSVCQVEANASNFQFMLTKSVTSKDGQLYRYT